MPSNELYTSPPKADFSKDKTVLWLNVKQDEPAQHIHHVDKYVEEALRSQFNVLKFIVSGKPRENEWALNKKFLKKMLRKADDPDYIEKNKAMAFKSLDEVFKDVPHIDYCFVNFDLIYLPFNAYVSPKDSVKLNSMMNEFFDYTSDTSDAEKRLIDETNSKVLKDFYKYCSMFAFSTCLYSMSFLLHEYLSITGKCSKFYVFCVDPDGYWPKWMQYGNTEFLYFADDWRGSRHMRGFDLAQINHLTSCSVDLHPEKALDFVWMGTLFVEKGLRSTVYDQYLAGLGDKISWKFYCPLTLNSVQKRETDKNKELTKKAFSGLFEAVSSNSHYAGFCPTDEVDEKTSVAKYSLITRCRSVYDSLNFRPVLYAKHGVLPLLDPQFDPSYLLYPKEVQDRLLVSSSEDILKRVAYFNSHDSEREELLLKIAKLLKVDRYALDADKEAKSAIHQIIPEYDPTK